MNQLNLKIPVDQSNLGERDAREALLGPKLDSKTAAKFPNKDTLLAFLDPARILTKASITEQSDNLKPTNLEKHKRAALEINESGQIKRVNHTDGSHDEIDYNSDGKPIRVTQYDKQKPQIEIFETPNLADSPIKLTIHDDGTIESGHR